MTLINLNALGITRGTPLFSGLNLTINRGDRLGLVAINGAGKSTLLKILAGKLEAGEGALTFARGLRVGHMEQEIPASMLATPLYDMVLQALPLEQAEIDSWRVDIALDDLQVPEELRRVPLGQLSGGWQRLALLAQVWVCEPDIILMDEPTNHLDLSRIGLLQRWINTLPRDLALVMASHDRAFLDEMTNRTLFLRRDNSRGYALPYSPAREALDTEDGAEARRFENDIKQAQQLRRQAAKLKNIGINSGSDLLITKTKQLTERAERMEEAARPSYREQAAGAIRLGNSGTHARALVTFNDAEVATPDGRQLFKTGKLWISRGERVVLLGHNGAGKTQLMNMVHRAILGDEGAIRAAPSVVLGHSDQELTQLDPAATPHTTISSRFDVGDQRARSLLADAGMNIDLQGSPVAALSGGQKARLAMLVLRLTRANMFLLDEPTNHLDIQGQEALERELVAHGASCLLVSHDRSFVRAIGNRFWQIEGKRLIEVDGPEGFFKSALAN